VTEEKLAGALGVLRTARLNEAASARVREQLEQAWRDRAAQRRRVTVPWFVPSIAAALLFLAFGAATLRAGADSALYGARIAVEDALVALHTDLDDRLDYIRELYDERTEEAARLEAVGNALAAGRARAAQDDALRLLNATAPKAQEPSPSPTPETSSAPVVLPSPTPPAMTVAPTTVPARTPTVTPPPTAPPVTKPTPSPTPTTFVVTVRGGIVNPDGSLANDVCVSTAQVALAPSAPTALTTTGCFMTATGGSLTARIPARKGQTITLYFSRYDAATGKTFRGYATFTVTGPNVSLGVVRLGV
jgi:outer membrane biosynthesis protein TonB